MAAPRTIGLIRRLSFLHYLLALSVPLSVLSFFFAQRLVDSSNRDKIELQKNDILLAFEKAFAQDMEVVQSIRSFLFTHPETTRSQFKSYVSSALERHPEILALERMVRIPHASRREYEASMRSRGDPGFEIVHLGAGGKIEVAAPRDEYFVITYAEPEAENHVAIGYDVGATPLLSETVRSAREHGTGVSPWIKLIQGHLGFVIYLPVSGSENFAVGVFRLKQFIEGALREKKAVNVDFILKERSPNREDSPVFLYDSAEGRLVERPGAAIKQTVHASAQFVLGNRAWEFVFFPSKNFASVLPRYLPFVVALLVLLMAGGFVFMLRERERRLKAETATRAREEFLDIASHELRTPLTPLKIELYLSRKYIEEAIPDSDRKAEHIKLLDSSDRQVHHMIRLIDDLLYASKLNISGVRLRLSPFDLGELIASVARKLASGLKAAGCELMLSLEPELCVDGDPGRIEQVLTNLVSNAIKFAPGAPVEIYLRSAGGDVVFGIRDRGVGIRREHLDKIFGRFERGGANKNIGGLGLGLYISRQIVIAHHGSIHVKSEPGQGAEFVVRIPRRFAHSQRGQESSLTKTANPAFGSD